MADSFFGFETSHAENALDDEPDCPFEDEDLGEEEEYDALNDETFGSEATIGDWEQDHEKLAEITESSRPYHQDNQNIKNGIDTNIENSLSRLILDDKKGSVPPPNIWNNISLSKFPKPSCSSPSPLKNVCTVEELERGLIANRPPPGISKPPHPSQQKTNGPFLFESLSLNGPPGFPPPVFLPPMGVPPHIRLPPPQYEQHKLPNQPGNLLRYPLPPHMMIPPGVQRTALRGAFCGNFPPPPHFMGAPLFFRPDHPMMPSFPENQTNQHPHGFTHTGNQRNLNRSFHHNDQQGNQPYFKNNQLPHHTNRNHPRNNHNHSQRTNGLGDYDEYAGLMNTREKQWLVNIQLLQLNTNQPYIDDYYYTVFCSKQNRQNDRNPRHSNNGNHRDSKDKDQDKPHQLYKVVYTPTQFENSLGKLQCGSVTAPRKIIDMDVVPNSDSQSTSVLQQKDNKKTRQLLLEIERLYTIQLELEDLNNPLALLTNQEPQEEENEPLPVKKTAPELIGAMWTSFLQLIQDDKLTGILNIRKGKTLLLRFLPYVNSPVYGKQLIELWKSILLGLSMIGRRDSHLLVNLYPEFQNWIETVNDFEPLLELVNRFLTPLTGSSKNNLGAAFTNKFGVSVIASILNRGENLFPTKNEGLVTAWSKFINSMIESIRDSKPCVAPFRPISRDTLHRHLKRMSSIKVEDHAVLQLFLTEANPMNGRAI